MKVLYLDANAQYINPSAALLPMLLLSAYPDLQFYGPGYSSGDAIAGGLARWVDVHGPFDVVIIGPWTPFFAEHQGVYEENIEFVRRYTVHAGFEASSLSRYFNDVLLALRSLPVPVKVVTSIALDTYASTQAQVNRLLESGAVVLGPNHQFTRPISEWPRDVFSREKHYQAKLSRLSDAWLDFLTAYPDRVVTACHYVGDHEFCLTSLDARPWDVSVPGVEYALRRDALGSLRSSGLHVAPKRYFHAFRAANRLGLPVYRHAATAWLYNALFQRTLRGSKMAYTASGGSGNLIRKFFEIPAAGAALVCVPGNGFRELGFEQGRNYLQVVPAELADLVKAFRSNPELQDIADAGRHLVLTRHSMRARASQIAQCFGALRLGTYRGAHWHDGHFIVSEARA